MKHKLLIIISLTVLLFQDLAAQKTIDTPYFTFSGNYQIVDQDHISSQNAYNYHIMSTNEDEYYQVGVMKYKYNPNYLNEIIKLSTEKYTKITFQGNPAISSERRLHTDVGIVYAKDIMFFNNGYFFTLLIAAESVEQRSLMHNKMKSNFKVK